jgi:hypothetical protein
MPAEGSTAFDWVPHDIRIDRAFAGRNSLVPIVARLLSRLATTIRCGGVVEVGTLGAGWKPADRVDFYDYATTHDLSRRPRLTNETAAALSPIAGRRLRRTCPRRAGHGGRVQPLLVGVELAQRRPALLQALARHHSALGRRGCRRARRLPAAAVRSVPGAVPYAGQSVANR